MVRRKELVQIDYVPRHWQRWFHSHKKRHNVFVVHRRAGKTHGVIHDLVDEALKFDKVDPKTGVAYKNPRYSYYATTNEQARDAAWQPLKDATKNIPGVRTNEQKMTVTWPHPRGICKINCQGTENFDAIRGGYRDGYVLDEYGDMHPDVRDKVTYPMITDRRGWEIIIGTPKGNNQFKQLYDARKTKPNWLTAYLDVYSTSVFDEAEIEDIKEEMSEEAFRQEYELHWDASPEGYFYERELAQVYERKAVTRVPYDSRYPVMTFWDLGVNDSGAIWFVQEIGRELAVIDYLENRDVGLDWYSAQVNEKEYNYCAHYLPHDVEHRSMETAEPRRQYLENQGLKNIITVPKTQSVMEDIHKVRVVFRKCVFDAVKCARGLECLAGYKKKWDSKNRVYMNKPVHNWASHGSDAFRQLGASYEPGMGKSYEDKVESLPTFSEGPGNVFGL